MEGLEEEVEARRLLAISPEREKGENGCEEVVLKEHVCIRGL